ncbi:hypothetical protein F8158_00060 [Bacillus cereus]|uniref:Group-specific protein n=1 Tax=Bacillus cereus TaxID=1396 RepID=A0AB34DCZ1_BACCE|nr:hypothetical protein [Bacillus cereus]KAB2502340.1 hypothetical protein F8158_00060 [Bacillus cereus]
MINDYSRFVDVNVAYEEMKDLLEQRLGRKLTELEDKSIEWFCNCDYKTVGVFYELFSEVSRK